MFAHSSVLVNHSEWNVSTPSESSPRMTEGHKQFGLEFEARGSRTWLFVRTWRKDSFYRWAVGVIDRYHGDASSDLVILGQVLCAIGISGLNFWESNTLVECYKGYLRSRYMRGLLDYPTFDVMLLKRCQKKRLPLCSGRSIPFR